MSKTTEELIEELKKLRIESENLIKEIEELNKNNLNNKEK